MKILNFRFRRISCPVFNKIKQIRVQRWEEANICKNLYILSEAVEELIKRKLVEVSTQVEWPKIERCIFLSKIIFKTGDQ